MIVPGTGKTPNDIMIVGEGPGAQEAREGEPFVGKSGQALSVYMQLGGLELGDCYKTNVVKHFVEGNPDPTPADIARWTPELEREIAMVRPKVIIAVGRFAAQWFLGDDAIISVVHGLPHTAGVFDETRLFRAGGAVVLPTYHPAFGFRNNDARALLMDDYERVGVAVRDYLAGKQLDFRDDEWAGREDYWDATGCEFAQYLERCAGDEIGIDTEGYEHSPWSIQVSCAPGEGVTLRYLQPDFAVGVAALQKLIDRGVLLVGHNFVMHDLAVMRACGVDVSNARIWDNYYALYLLRLEPLGQKPAAWRWCGMRGQTYKELIAGAGEQRQLDYLWEVRNNEWAKPEPYLDWGNDGTAKMKQPNHVHRYVDGILEAYYAGQASDEVEDEGDESAARTAPLTKRWQRMHVNVRGPVEAVMGEFPIPTLDDVPLDLAVRYASRDPDQALRLYHKLLPELEAKGVMGIMQRSVDVLPVFEEMQSTGLPASRSKFVALRDKMWHEMEELGRHISCEYYGGKPFNPKATEQVASLMRRHGLVGTKRTPTGRMSTGKPSIEHLRYEHPAIEAVMTWREKQHIKDMFCDPTLELMDASADVQTIKCRIKIANTTTRRLATADPNLLAFPKHEKPGGDYGKQVRRCFECPDGQVWLECDYCLAPGTRVLTADLRWVPIETLCVGDSLVAIDEEPEVVNGRRQERRLRTGVVEATGRRVRRSKVVRMSNGASLTASYEHPWLVREYPHNQTSRWVWKNTSELKVGDRIRRFADPWESETTYEAGWLAGIIDGEGSLNSIGTLAICQRPGAVLDGAIDGLLSRGYQIGMSKPSLGGFDGSKNDTRQVWVCGMVDCMRIIGTLRPKRMLTGVSRLWEGRTMGRRRKGKQTPDSPETYATVVSIDEDGEREVISIQTSTKTFIAEGFFTHNSQIESRVLAHESGDPVLCALFNSGRDIHAETAARMFGVAPDQISGVQRFFAKKINFSIPYGTSGSGLATQLQMMGIKGWPKDVCQAHIDNWKSDLYPVAAAYIERAEREIGETGMVRDCWGMMRYLPAVWSEDAKVAAEAKRQGVNHKIQGGAQGIMHNAIRGLRQPIRDMQEQGVGVWWTLQVHDSLLFRVVEEYVEQVRDVVLDGMVRYCGLNMAVPVLVDAKTARTWGDL